MNLPPVIRTPAGLAGKSVNSFREGGQGGRGIATHVRRFSGRRGIGVRDQEVLPDRPNGIARRAFRGAGTASANPRNALLNHIIMKSLLSLAACVLLGFGPVVAAEPPPAETRKLFETDLQKAATGPEKAAALIGIGVTFLSGDDPAAARAEFEKALAIGEITPEQTGQAWLKIGAAYCVEYQWQPATVALEKVIALQGASPANKAEALLLIGGMTEGRGAEGWARSKAAWLRALAIPGIPSEQKTAAQKALVTALMGLRLFADARAVMKELLANETLPAPFRAATQASIGRTFLYERNLALAREEFLKALAVPGATDALKADMQLHTALTYYEAQDYARAKPELMKVLDMPGNDVRPPWDKGRMGYRPGREAMLRLRLRNLLPDGRTPLKVLFIGSSHTIREDVPGLVMQLADSAPADRPRIVAGDFVRMGTGITTYWNDGDTPDTARGLIASEPWDAVVFETFYTVKYENMLKYATLFTDLIRSRNAKAVIYESPAARGASYPDVFRKFHDENVALSKALGIPVAPGVRAWLEYFGPKPTQEQFGTLYADWIHATPKGAYLNACCIYSALTGFSPVGLAHPGLSDDEAAVFQQAAWKACLETNPDVKR